MTQGEINIKIVKRLEERKSQRRCDKTIDLDQIKLYNYCESGIEGFLVYFKSGMNPVFIRRDERDFVNVILNHYGYGDYSIQVWGKGKARKVINTTSSVRNSKRGLRRFWDGIISKDGSFYRRKEANFMKDPSTVSVFQKQSLSLNTESHIGKYMKTCRPGVWYRL